MSVDSSRHADVDVATGAALWRLRHGLGGAWFAACIAAGVSFVALWLGVVAHWHIIDAMDGLDPRTDDLGLRHHSHTMQAWQIYCNVLSPLTFDVIAVLGAIAGVVRRAWRDAASLVLAVLASEATVTALKEVTDRPRPGARVGTAASSSFPSGHATSALVVVLVLLAVWWPMLRLRPTLAAIVTAAGVAVVASLGVGRVVVHAHHPSDVIAGYALGVFWAAGSLLVTGVVTSRWAVDVHRRRWRFGRA